MVVYMVAPCQCDMHQINFYYSIYQTLIQSIVDMSETSLAQLFVDAVRQQAIFSDVIVPFKKPNGGLIGGSDRLVCRYDNCLFYAVGSLVRFCYINDKSSNYRFMTSKAPLFVINSIHLNSSGTLLALVGTEDVVVYSIPQTLSMEESSQLVVKSFQINNIGGKVQKLLWNPLVENDSALVILNEHNEIKCYDIGISLDEPQIDIDLTEFSNFPKSASVTSISFGSSANLLGALTLYITSSSQIFAIYPFIYKSAKLALSKSQVEHAYEESLFAIQLIEEKFPLETLSKSLHSYLKVSTIRQYEYYSSLKSQFELVQGTEKRKTSIGSFSSLSLFEQTLPGSFKQCLQGPIYSFANGHEIRDIQNIFDNDDIPILALIQKAKDELNLSFEAQMKPLIMMWNQLGDKFENPFAISELKPEPVKPIGYVKPKRGFGYVDLDTVEPENKEISTSTTNAQEENKFWTSDVSQLNVLAVDNLPLKPQESDDISIKAFPGAHDSVILKIGGNTIAANPSKWLTKLISKLVIGGSIGDLRFDTQYTVFPGKEPELGSALVTDIFSKTGKFLIQIKDTASDNLIVTPFSKVNKTSQPTSKEQVLPIPNRIEPLAELVAEVANVKTPDLSKEIKVENRNQKLSGNIESLADVNEVSNKVINQVSIYNTMIIKLNLILTTELEGLQKQISKLKEVDEEKFDNEKLDEIKNKVNSLITKQDEIDRRMTNNRTKLITALQNQVCSKSLPLSTIEKQWFEEINGFANQLNYSNDNSVAKRVRDLQAQVKELASLSNNNNGENDLHKYSEKLKELESRQEVHKLKLWLEEEGKLIEQVKQKLQEDLKIS